MPLLLACDSPHQPSPDIAIGEAWTREIAPGQSAAAVYLTVTNRGPGDDRLVAAEATIAAAATLHSSTSSGGIARMRVLQTGLELPSGSRIALSPGGTHIMLSGLKQPLRPGETVALTLAFARSGRKSTSVRVVPVEAGDHTGHERSSE